jgi:hypothetical protein
MVISTHPGQYALDLTVVNDTYPVHTLSRGFPRPPAPPLESYWPPASEGLILSSWLEFIHPVTVMVGVVCQPSSIVEDGIFKTYVEQIGPL